MKQDLLLTGAGRQRQGRQTKTGKAKTEKTDKDREGKDREDRQRQRRQKNKLVYSKMFVSYNGRLAVTVQRISQEYDRSAFWTVIVPVSVQPC